MLLLCKTSTALLLWSTLVVATGCGTLAGNPEESKPGKGGTAGGTTSTVLENQTPPDSTGGSAQLKLLFTSILPAGLSLADSPANEATPTAGTDPATSITLDNGVVISYARFNIAKVKLKPEAEVSSAETTLAKEEKDADDATIDALADGSEAGALIGAPESPGKSAAAKEAHAEKEALHKKIKADRAPLAKKEQEALTSESAADPATKFVGPYVYDAVARKTVSDDASAALADGSYRRVEFQMKRCVTGDDAEPLFGNVFAIRGTFKRGDTAVPFQIDWHSALNFRLVAPTPMQLAAAENATLLIGFHLAEWFAGINLAEADVASDGTVYIDKNSNQKIMQDLRRNIRTSTTFGKDTDDDRKLAPGEASGKGIDIAD